MLYISIKFSKCTSFINTCLLLSLTRERNLADRFILLVKTFKQPNPYKATLLKSRFDMGVLL